VKKIGLIGILFLFFCVNIAFADEIDDCIKNYPGNQDSCITLIQKKVFELNNAIAPLQKESVGIRSKISSAKSQIVSMENQMILLTKRLIDKEADMEVQRILMGERVRRYYINSKKYTPIMIFLSSGESSGLLRQYTLFQAVISQDKNTVSNYILDLKNLELNKAKVLVEKNKIAVIKKDMETRFGFLAGEIKKAEAYKAVLSAKQRELEAQRFASLNLPTSLGAGPLMCTDDRKIDPGFGSGFAFFTFGIPHHVGLNQYGAFGRANVGQNYKDIINAYYNGVSIEKKPNITIKVKGYGSMSLENYLLGIYEVPSSWPMEALKAQVLAARSYALSYTNNGAKEICTTQACQVYKGGNKGGGWEQAVKATEGEVVTKNGQPITAWFASTAGAYTYTSGDIGWKSTDWTKRTRDTNGDINSFDDLFKKAYDKDSPCFYAAQGFRKKYNKSAWLKPSEVADVVNVILLAQKDSSVQNHLCYKNDSAHGCTDTWDFERVKTELRNRGGSPFNLINSVNISDWNKNEGRVNTISFSGDAGGASFAGATFKSYFNIRAPANISIVGPLYNVEKR